MLPTLPRGMHPRRTEKKFSLSRPNFYTITSPNHAQHEAKNRFLMHENYKSYDPNDEKVKSQNYSRQWCPLSPEECTRDARKKNFPCHVLNFIPVKRPNHAKHGAKNRFLMHEKL